MAFDWQFKTGKRKLRADDDGAFIMWDGQKYRPSSELPRWVEVGDFLHVHDYLCGPYHGTLEARDWLDRPRPMVGGGRTRGGDEVGTFVP